MPLLIPDETLRDVGLNESEALVEIACRLFDAGKLTLWQAAKLAKLDRTTFEGELLGRAIPVYRPTPEDLTEDLATLRRLGR